MFLGIDEVCKKTAIPFTTANQLRGKALPKGYETGWKTSSSCSCYGVTYHHVTKTQALLPFSSTDLKDKQDLVSLFINLVVWSMDVHIKIHFSKKNSQPTRKKVVFPEVRFVQGIYFLAFRDSFGNSPQHPRLSIPGLGTYRISYIKLSCLASMSMQYPFRREAAFTRLRKANTSSS